MLYDGANVAGAIKHVDILYVCCIASFLFHLILSLFILKKT